MMLEGEERSGLVDTTVGSIIFNAPVPQNLGYVDRTDPAHWLDYEISFRVTKKTLPDIISRCLTRNGTRACAKMLDAIKAQGYKYSTLSAISVAVCDAVIPPQKDELLKEADEQVSKVGKLFNRGLISEEERYKKDHRHLAGHHRQGLEGPGRQPAQGQRDLYDGRFGRPRLHEPDQAAGRHARPAGQHRRPHHRDAHPRQLP